METYQEILKKLKDLSGSDLVRLNTEVSKNIYVKGLQEYLDTLYMNKEVTEIINKHVD